MGKMKRKSQLEKMEENIQYITDFFFAINMAAVIVILIVFLYFLAGFVVGLTNWWST